LDTDLLPGYRKEAVKRLGQAYVQAAILRFDALAEEYFNDDAVDFETVVSQLVVKHRQYEVVDNALTQRRSHWVIRSREKRVAGAASNGGLAEKVESAERVPVPPIAGSRNVSERRAAVDAYIEEVLAKTGKRIARTSIWTMAGDKSRTEFERWQSFWYELHGRKTNKAADRRFTRILTTKPHLK
jgi:hypothetical protein